MFIIPSRLKHSAKRLNVNAPAPPLTFLHTCWSSTNNNLNWWQNLSNPTDGHFFKVSVFPLSMFPLKGMICLCLWGVRLPHWSMRDLRRQPFGPAMSRYEPQRFSIIEPSHSVSVDSGWIVVQLDTTSRKATRIIFRSFQTSLAQLDIDFQAPCSFENPRIFPAFHGDDSLKDGSYRKLPQVPPAWVPSHPGHLRKLMGSLVKTNDKTGL